MQDTFTIGFTQTNAHDFFERLVRAGVKKVIDVRLNNTSQLSGFAKATDLPYLLKKIGDIEYKHEPLLAPTDHILKPYKAKKMSWDAYERDFIGLIADRHIEEKFTPEFFNRACLLCSEAKAHHCHRRLVCEYLNDKWGSALSVRHL